MLRACRGSDNSRPPHSARESVKTTARRSACGSPKCRLPQDFRPGEQTLNLPAAASNVAEPQAGPSDVLSDRVAVLDAELVPRASKHESAQSALSPPQSVEERTCGVLDVLSPPADCVALASKEVESVPWRDVQFDIGCRR